MTPPQGAADPSAGEVERYTLLRRLGSGAFGTVYLAHDLFLDEPCAVKMPLRPHPDLRSFLEEPRLLNRVRNPAIVALRDIEKIQGVLCLVMEYVGGGSLRDRIGRFGAGRPLPPPFAIQVAREVLSALAGAHSVGVLHRDIKPDNVLLTEDGHAKVTDFGIARIVEATGGVDHTMHPGGTIVYMSPEAFAGECSEVCDVWATAVMLYEMLTGAPPFPGPSTAELVRQIEAGAVVPILSRVPSLARPIAEVVAGALARPRESRIRSVAELDRALAALGANVEETSRVESGVPSSEPAPPPDPAPVPRGVGKGGEPRSDLPPTTGNIDAMIVAARNRLDCEEFSEAVEDLRRLLAAAPGHPGLHRALGDAYRFHGDEIWAFEEYERAFLLDRTDRVAADLLADLGLRLHRTSRAVEALAALVAMDPGDASYHRRLALACSEEGDRPRAIAHMRRSLQIDPAQPRMERILRRWEAVSRPAG
jgi:hypothetical protein